VKLLLLLRLAGTFSPNAALFSKQVFALKNGYYGYLFAFSVLNYGFIWGRIGGGLGQGLKQNFLFLLPVFFKKGT